MPGPAKHLSTSTNVFAEDVPLKLSINHTHKLGCLRICSTYLGYAKPEQCYGSMARWEVENWDGERERGGKVIYHF